MILKLGFLAHWVSSFLVFSEAEGTGRQMSWEDCVTILRTSLGKPSLKQLPGTRVSLGPEEMERVLGEAQEPPPLSSLGVRASIPQSSGVATWT